MPPNWPLLGSTPSPGKAKRGGQCAARKTFDYWNRVNIITHDFSGLTVCDGKHIPHGLSKRTVYYKPHTKHPKVMCGMVRVITENLFNATVCYVAHTVRLDKTCAIVQSIAHASFRRTVCTESHTVFLPQSRAMGCRSHTFYFLGHGLICVPSAMSLSHRVWC